MDRVAPTPSELRILRSWPGDANFMWRRQAKNQLQLLNPAAFQGSTSLRRPISLNPYGPLALQTTRRHIVSQVRAFAQLEAAALTDSTAQPEDFSISLI